MTPARFVAAVLAAATVGFAVTLAAITAYANANAQEESTP